MENAKAIYKTLLWFSYTTSKQKKFIYSEEKQKVEILNDHFSKQNSLDDTTATLPNIVQDDLPTLDTLNITPV